MPFCWELEDHEVSLLVPVQKEASVLYSVYMSAGYWNQGNSLWSPVLKKVQERTRLDNFIQGKIKQTRFLLLEGESEGEQVKGL